MKVRKWDDRYVLCIYGGGMECTDFIMKLIKLYIEDKNRGLYIEDKNKDVCSKSETYDSETDNADRGGAARI